MLPFSTAKVERTFSTMEIIKSERTNLSCSTLNDLLEESTEGPELSEFSADSAVDLWWRDCSSGRRVDQKSHKTYSRQKNGRSAELQTTSDSDFEQDLDLGTWDDWFREGLSKSP